MIPFPLNSEWQIIFTNKEVQSLPKNKGRMAKDVEEDQVPKKVITSFLSSDEDSSGSSLDGSRGAKNPQRDNNGKRNYSERSMARNYLIFFINI